MTPSHLILALLLAGVAAGCGANDELTVRGDAAITFTPDYVERFTFDAETQLQKDDLAAGAEGVFGGHCVLSQGGLTAVDVEVERPGASGGLTSIRIQAEADEGGAFRAVVDGVAYDGTSDSGACTIRTLYAMHHDGTAGVEVDCDITDVDGNTATASADLHFTGCMVTD
jgi:hypothetical protein